MGVTVSDYEELRESDTNVSSLLHSVHTFKYNGQEKLF